MNDYSCWLIYNDRGEVINFEKLYKFPAFKEEKIDIYKNNKFGTIDLETYLDENGNSVVYSAASVIDGIENTHVEYGNNPDEIIYNLFNYIFNMERNKLKKDRVKYFYAHNGSNFDFLFILGSLAKYHEFLIKPVIKDSSQIIELKIIKEYQRKEGSKTKDKIIIILRDSKLFLNSSLEKLTKSFINENEEKGFYPYLFVNKNNLEYKGVVPSIEFFKNPKDINTQSKYKEFVERVNNYYDLKNETIKYNINDCIILYIIMEKFKKIIYDNFNINIERSKTAPGLSMVIYLSNFYNINMNIRIVKGDVEKNIRKSYTGGFSKVYDQKITNAYHYDMNAQYPYVMLNDMPTGNPIFSRSSNLDDYFGFVYAEVVKTEKVNTALLYHKDKNGFSVLNDDKEFEG
jgi:hypothetical protein